MIFICFSSCGQSEKVKIPIEANMKCNDLYAKGQLGYSKYTFCAITLVESHYSYKKGNWTFWSSNGNKIATGKFKNEKQIIEDQGGCPYEIIEEKVEMGKWQFWDENKMEIKPNPNLIRKIEMCKPIIIN